MKTKTFDAVKMMREIRDQLAKDFAEDSEAENQALKNINAKYGLKAEEKTQAE